MGNTELKNEEKEFLATYKMTDYKRPSVTADCVIFAGNPNDIQTLKVLLIKRKNHPFKNCLALPGGFVNEDETVEQAAARELMEETSVENLSFQLVNVFSKPNRDPRGWVITLAYTTVVNEGDVRVKCGDDAAAADWHKVAELENESLAFDHREIIVQALNKVQKP